VVVGVGAAVGVLEAVLVFRFVGALVERVGDAVVIVVWVGAAVGVLEAILVLGLARAAIEPIDDAVAIGVEIWSRWDVGMDRRDRRRVRHERERQYAAQIGGAEPAGHATARGEPDREPPVHLVVEAGEPLDLRQRGRLGHRTGDLLLPRRRRLAKYLGDRPQRIEGAIRGTGAPRDAALLRDVGVHGLAPEDRSGIRRDRQP